MALFVCFLVLFYGLVWLAFIQVRPAYHRMLNAGAQTCYSLVGRRIEFRSRGLDTVYRSYLRPMFEADFSPRPIYSNTPFFWTLLLVTPGLAWRRRALYFLIGTALLATSQVAFMITKVESSLITAGHAQAGAPLIWSNLDNFFEVSGKAFIPIAIWLAMCLPYLLGKVDRPPAAEDEMRSAGRNDPCPCGSGRKHKHCCGKA